MIVDCHSRIWESAQQLGPYCHEWLARQGGQADLSADTGEHAAAMREVQYCLIWGFRSRHLRADIPNTFLANYLAMYPDRMLGVAAVDIAEDDYFQRLTNIAKRPEFVGVTVSPAAQGFHPSDSRAMRVYEFCADQHLPVFIDVAADMAAGAVLEYARPMLLDEPARAFPDLTLVISGMGWPWVDEAVALLAKQPRVFADLGGIARKGPLAYQAIFQAHQAAVTDKVLFASDFPFSTPDRIIERLYRLNELTAGTNLPGVPREVLRGIIERDALAALGITPPPAPSAAK